MFFIDFHENCDFYIWKLSRDDSGMVQDIFRRHFGLGNNLKKSILDPKTEFSIFGETSFFSFRQKLTFGVTNLEIYPVEYVHMDHTDHLGFRSNFILICKFPSSFHFLGKSDFLRLTWKLINSLEVYSESSPMLGTARRGFCFWKTSISGIWDMPILEKVDFPYIWYVKGIRGWYVNGTWMVHEWYVDDTWMVRGWYTDSIPKRTKRVLWESF